MGDSCSCCQFLIFFISETVAVFDPFFTGPVNSIPASVAIFATDSSVSIPNSFAKSLATLLAKKSELNVGGCGGGATVVSTSVGGGATVVSTSGSAGATSGSAGATSDSAGAISGSAGDTVGSTGIGGFSRLSLSRRAATNNSEAGAPSYI